LIGYFWRRTIRIVRRLSFVKNLYAGDTLEEAATRVGKSESTGSRWARRWNEGGLGQLTPNFGDGRPPKLGEYEQEQLVEMLREDQPWQPQEIQHLIDEEFDIEYHPVYLSEFLKDLGLSYAIPRTKRPSRPENAEGILGERVDDALAEDMDEPHNKREDDADEGWVVDDDICTDGGTVVGFFDASHPQPYDNSRRMWYVDDPHHERPLVQIFEPAVGFYALNGESVVSFPEDQTKERICECLERSASRIPRRGFFSSWITTSHTHVNTRADVPINLVSTSCFSLLTRLISTQLSKFGRVSSGNFHH